MLSSFIILSAFVSIQAADVPPPPRDLEPRASEYDPRTDPDGSQHVSIEVRASRARADRPERVHPVDRSNNLERVLDENGQPVAPWIIERNCRASACTQTIRNAETGEIGMLDGEWQGAFVRSNRGDEVVVFRPERPAPGPRRQFNSGQE